MVLKVQQEERQRWPFSLRFLTVLVAKGFVRLEALGLLGELLSLARVMNRSPLLVLALLLSEVPA